MKIPYRLGLDIGTNSIGWCVYRLNEQGAPTGIVRMGSRIFSDGRHPKTMSSLAAERRLARQMRRRHDRVLKRQSRFLQGLIRYGLMPEDDVKRQDLSQLDPYELRLRGLDHPLEPHELGRALYHLVKRRGFQSSRKTKGEQEKETGKIDSAIARTKEAIKAAGCRTIGEYLAQQHAQRKPVRARTGLDGEYLFYSQRALVAAEFDALWEKQTSFHPEICTDEARKYLRDTLLFQRPLKPVDPGRCPFEPDQPRIPQCSPLFQRFRLLQDLNHLRVRQENDERPLTLAERNELLTLLSGRKELITFAKLGKAINLPRDAKFNFDSKDGKRKGFVGDATAPIAEALGSDWQTLTNIQREAIAVLIEMASDDAALQQALRELPAEIETCKKIIRSNNPERIAPWLDALAGWPKPLKTEQIERLLTVTLPEDYASLSRKAIEKIVARLESDVISYDKAVSAAGYQSHSDFYTGEIFHRLPYYGRILSGYVSPHPRRHEVLSAPDDSKPSQMFNAEKYYGKIANPTVHVGLGQLRLVVNEVIRRWGAPQEIIVELAREFGMSGQRRRDLLSEQAENQDRNEKLNAELRKLGQRENRENRQRLMLWQEQSKGQGQNDAMDHYCVYSGKRLNLSQLFSSDVEIDHILPFSRSLDDSLSNKVLCTARANRDKRNQTPYEAFGHNPNSYVWDEIEARAIRLPPNKAKRFKENALDIFLDNKDFLDRHLTDTAYLSRVARQYLIAVCSPDKVWVATGRLTGMLRKAWGLNDILSPDGGGKNRDDHRHHAVDAAIIGACNRATIQKLSRAAERAEESGENRLLRNFPQPWDGFREELHDVVERIVVSHKPDHGPEGGLHNDTNYGWRDDANKQGAMLVSHRKPLSAIKGLADLDGIPDPHLKQRIADALQGKTSPKDIKIALEKFTQDTGVRRIQVHERLSVIPIGDRYTKNPYRYVKGDGNYCFDIYRTASGKWDSDVITTYEANRPGFDHRSKVSKDGFPLIMRLRKGDFVKLEHDGRNRIMRVAKFTAGTLSLAEHHEANVDARDRDKNIAFSYLRKSADPLRSMAARNVTVDPLGYVNDPGFPE